MPEDLAAGAFWGFLCIYIQKEKGKEKHLLEGPSGCIVFVFFWLIFTLKKSDYRMPEDSPSLSFWCLRLCFFCIQASKSCLCLFWVVDVFFFRFLLCFFDFVASFLLVRLGAESCLIMFNHCFFFFLNRLEPISGFSLVFLVLCFLFASLLGKGTSPDNSMRRECPAWALGPAKWRPLERP